MIVCRILKNKEATLTGASSCISMWLVSVRKETRRPFGFVGRGLKSGTVSVALFFWKSISGFCVWRALFLRSPSSLFSAVWSRRRRHDFVPIVVNFKLSQVPQTHRSVAIRVRNRFQPKCEGHSVWSDYTYLLLVRLWSRGVHWSHRAGFGSKRINIVSQCSSRAWTAKMS